MSVAFYVLGFSTSPNLIEIEEPAGIAILRPDLTWINPEAMTNEQDIVYATPKMN